MPTIPAEDLLPIDPASAPDMVNTDASGSPLPTPFPGLDRTKYRDAEVWNTIKNAVIGDRESLRDLALRTIGGRTGAARLKLAYGAAPTALADTAGDVSVDVEDFDEEADAPVVQVSQPAAGVARIVMLTVGFETPASMSLVLSFLGENVYVVDSEDASYVIEKRGTYLVAGRSFAIGEDLTTGWQVISIGGPSAEEFDEFREDIERGYGGGAAPETGAPFLSYATMTIDIRTANRTLALQAPEEIYDRSWLGRRMTLIVLCGPHMLTLQPGRAEIAIDIAGAAGSPGSPAFAPTLTQGVQRFDVVGGLSADDSTPTWFVTPVASIFDVVSGVLPVAGSVSAGPLDISRRLAFASAGSYSPTLPAPGDVLAPIDITVVYGGSAAQSLTWGRNGGTINGAAADFATPGSATGRMIRITNPGPSVASGGNWIIQALANRDEVVTTARTITAGTGLTGGGDLSADRTIALDATNVAKLLPLGAFLDITGASATIDGTYETYSCSHAAALTALTLSTANWPVGATRRIRKSNATSFGITITPQSGGAIQGNATNAAVTLSGSTSTSSTDRPDMWWAITRDTSTTWRIISCGPQMVGATAVANDYLGAAGSAASPTFRTSFGGLYGDATKGPTIAGGGVDRLLLRTDGIAQIIRPTGTNNTVVELTNGSGTTAILVGSGSPEGSVTAAVGRSFWDVANGRLYLKRTGSGNTGWAQIDRCESGTYTPTATAVSNVDIVTPGLAFWVRVGDVVLQAGRVDIDPTAAGAASVRLSLAVASNFAATTDAAGVVGGISLNAGGSRVDADATNDRLLITINTAATVSNAHWYVCGYRVL